MRSPAYLVILFLALFQLNSLRAQTGDSSIYSSESDEFRILHKRIDSLQAALIESQKRMVTHSDFESIFRSINEDDQEFTNENRRSKRRALDSLFSAAVLKPGQLTFTGQMMSVMHWDGKFKNTAVNTVVGTLDLFAISSFGKNNLVFINLQGVGGDGPASSFESFNGFHAGSGTTQAEDGVSRLTILEAWTEFRIGFSTITAGKIDLTNYFDPNSVANDEYSQFLSNGFVNSAALAAPSNSPGVVMNLNLPFDITARAGVSSLNNSGIDIFEDLFAIVQLGKSFNTSKKTIGGIRAYIFRHPVVKDGFGYGVSADLKIIDRLYGFGRFGMNSDSLGLDFRVKNTWSTGLQARNYPITKNLQFTGGAGRSVSQSGIQEGEYENEIASEVYVRFALRNKFYLSPVYQNIRNGAGISGNDISLLAVRTRVVF